ncbi:MAG: NAD-dependent epimerase/dehydratase family protein [Dehalococcoidia bacterium]
MRALVTGGAGQIGSHIVEGLLSRGWDVTVLDSLDPVTHPRGRPPWVPSSVRFIEGDIVDADAMAAALDGVQVVFHEAAYQGLLPDFSRFFHVNGAGTALIYETIVERKLPVQKVIVASSQAVYGEGAYRCPEHGPAYPVPRPLAQLMRGDWEFRCDRCAAPMLPQPTDEAVVNGATSYAVSKHTQEEIALGLGRTYGIPSVALRYAITFGPRQSFNNAYSGLSGIVAQRVLNSRPVVVYEDGLQTRDIVFVEDVASANLFVMERDDANFEVFNVGTGRAVSVLEFVRVLAGMFGLEPDIETKGEFRLGDVRHLVPDVGKLERMGWHALHTLEHAAEAYAKWIRTQPEVRDNVAAALDEMRRRGVVLQAARQAA